MILKLQHRFVYLNYLLKNKATGTPKELASKLGLTERAWYKLRDQLVNDLELPIAYCNERRSYYYTEEGSFEFGFRRFSALEKEKQ
jgi:hypothetical protein